MAKRRGKMQEEVLEVLRKQDQPQSAYELLGQMREDNPSLAPMSVYRALSALTEKGEVHRLESLKSFVLCKHSDHDDGCLMAICEECGTVEEHIAPTLVSNVSAEAAKSGFAPKRHVIEVHGVCAGCRPEQVTE